ncbi:MAG: hypothetical protein R2727_08965 [Bacteroidales bacterium]
MKTGIKITAMTIILLLAGSGITKAQYGRAGQARRSTPQYYCMDIPDLTDTQKAKITALGEAHRKQMDELRQAKYNAPDIYTRNEIDAKMLMAQNEHLKNIELLLTDTQKEYYRNNFANQRPGFRANRAPVGRGNGYRAGGRGFRGRSGKVQHNYRPSE